MVDSFFATADPNVYALGDVIDRVQLTPVAIQEAMVLIDHLYGDGATTINYDNIPTAVFSQPEFGSIWAGLWPGGASAVWRPQRLRWALQIRCLG